MNVLFLTLFDIKSINNYGIYEDLLREFSKKGHDVVIVSPSERRHGEKTRLIREGNSLILKVKTGNIQKTNLIEKGIATVLLEKQYITAIKKYLPDIKFDLVLYSTPPITLAGAVRYIKKRDGAKTYLLLKDIFPQNAVDIGMMSKNEIKGLIYKYFRNKEKKLYALSDSIGCMSPANVEYVIKNNPEILPYKVEVCPNCIEPRDLSISSQERGQVRKKYGIPLDKKVFVYGGNLGKPQGIPFLIDCLRRQEKNENIFFLIIGDGIEYGKLESYINEGKPKNVKVMSRLPKSDYDRIVLACDVGMIFLDHRFTIPNFPSRLLSYMQAKMPVLACTDRNTDVGDVIVHGGFGWWCESNDAEEFKKKVEYIIATPREELSEMGEKAYKYLCENYTVEKGYDIIQKNYSKRGDMNGWDSDNMVKDVSSYAR